MSRSGIFTLVAIAAATATAAPAHASLATFAAGALVVDGLPGEVNDVTLSRGSAGSVRVEDAGAPLLVGDGCVADGAAAICTGAGGWVSAIHVRLRDGDDRAVVVDVGTSVDVDGGDGADVLRSDGHGVLRGGAGPDDLAEAMTLHGDDGDDRLAEGRGQDGGAGEDVLTAVGSGSLLTGGPGRDRLLGGAGDDVLVDDDGPLPSSDLYDGGAGIDEVVLTGVAPVLVDLDEDLAARGGVADAIRAVEAATGGAGDDVLRGSERGEILDGGPGDDRVDGDAGADVVIGDSGDDTLRGGAGDDEVGAELEPGADRLDGGPGFDVVTGGAGADRFRVTAFDFVDGGVGHDHLRVVGRGATVSVEGDGPGDRVTCRRRAFAVDADRGDRVDRRCDAARR